MPLYEYHCRVCGQDFEAIISQAQASAPVQCMHCDSVSIRGTAHQDHIWAVVRKFPLPSQHIWRGSSDGAMPKGKR